MMNVIKRTAVAASITLGLVLVPAAAFAAQAAGTTSSPMTQVFGTVASSDSSGFVVTTAHASVIVKVTGSTSFVPESAASAAAGFATGDSVFVTGSGYAKNFAAGRVTFDTAPFPVPNSQRT